AEVLPPPLTLDPAGERRPVAGVEPGFLLCVSRLLPYKRVDAVVTAVQSRRSERLVVVGGGPDLGRMRAQGWERTTFLGPVPDAELRWLYASCDALGTAANEDFGLTPLEAAAFGKPSAVPRRGGFLDTVVEGATGVFFEGTDP